MVKNHFSRKCLCLLIILAIVSITGGDVQGAKEEKEKDTKEKTYAITEAQLQSHIMSFADLNYTKSHGIHILLENITKVTITQPIKATTGDIYIKALILSHEVDAYSKQKNDYCQNKASIFSVVMGQCSDAMKAKLEAYSNYIQISNNSDIIKLLTLLRETSYDYES